jgi:preprotein translocase subunit SecD
MSIGGGRFNIYLTAAMAAALLCGCQTSKSRPPETSLRVHAEAQDQTLSARKISFFRTNPVEMRVDASPLLTDMDVTEASVVEALGGFALKIAFNQRGQWMLERHSSLNIGRRLGIFVQFGEKPAKALWVAAPVISSRITDGTLIFTPDATREEAEQIAAGLGEKPKEKKTAEDNKE